ncbi:Fimbrial protein precursor (Pilin) [Thioalkalivibrio nitratireducens DSM 14787]|uniref:Fimbrial protein (Pilin) n=1 Tax=Thioalkalivibrio nitratireducens (strain DSM 14787 / UNIQEM 213 / ALEN2) TaxID=1255043 RepID=L0DRZ3_THIND|nr:pilin [Thioalkalivibrio nitratireducens]AGA31765.1 Fimbrial protein precursor (Pilin) [Thioalkalivibrio nitratireducens DSM 14787]
MKHARHTQQGFTLIELMIVVAIIGILAAIALPAYQDYTVRAKMSEAITAASSARTTIAEYVSTFSDLPTDGYSVEAQESNFVNAVRWQNQQIEVLVSNEVGGGIADDSILFLRPTGYTTGAGQVVWECGSTAIAQKYLPATCRN